MGESPTSALWHTKTRQLIRSLRCLNGLLRVKDINSIQQLDPAEATEPRTATLQSRGRITLGNAKAETMDPTPPMMQHNIRAPKV